LSDLSLRSTRILENVGGAGGGIHSGGNLALKSCLIARNFAPVGGAIFRQDDFELSLKDTRIVDNISQGGEQIEEI
jgi:hypothetical protein